MRPVLLIVLALPALLLLAAPTVRALGVSAQPGEATDPVPAALSRWCVGRDSRVCAAWRAEARRGHHIHLDAERPDGVSARVVLRARAAQIALAVRPRASGWQIDRARLVPTVRCGTAAFAALVGGIRPAADARWAGIIDGCRPDAREPVEVPRAALRPVLTRGGEARAALEHGARRLELQWATGRWRPAPR